MSLTQTTAGANTGKDVPLHTHKTWFPPAVGHTENLRRENSQRLHAGSKEGELCACAQRCTGKAPAGQQLRSNLAPTGRTSLALVKSFPSPHTVTVPLVIVAPFSDTGFYLKPLQPLTQSTPEFLKVLHYVSLHFIFSYTTRAVVCTLIISDPH